MKHAKLNNCGLQIGCVSFMRDQKLHGQSTCQIVGNTLRHDG